jgi:hypothetical protein
MWTPLTEPTVRLPDYEDVRRAAKRLEGVAHRTPVLTSRTANERTGGELFFNARISSEPARSSSEVPTTRLQL